MVVGPGAWSHVNGGVDELESLHAHTNVSVAKVQSTFTYLYMHQSICNRKVPLAAAALRQLNCVSGVLPYFMSRSSTEPRTRVWNGHCADGRTLGKVIGRCRRCLQTHAGKS